MLATINFDMSPRGDADWPPWFASALKAVMLREAIGHVVAEATGSKWTEIVGPHRGNAKTVHARHLAMYLAHVGSGLSLTATGELFERDRRTVAHAVARIEDCREFDLVLDRTLDAMERSIALSLRRQSWPTTTPPR